MELVESVVETKASASLPWEETLIMPLGDIQLGAEGCDESKLRGYIEWGMKHGAYFLGMGDYVDVASPSNRQVLRSANLYDSVQDALEEAADSAVQRFLKLVKGTEGRWLGLLEGHHYFEFQDGTTSDTRIAQALKAPFLGSCAFLRLKFAGRSKSQGRTGCTIWCHHGQGGGSKVSAPLNKLENLMHAFDADVYLIGHQHKLVAAPIDQLYMTQKKPYTIKHRTKIIACTGSFLRGYTAGSKRGLRAQGGYVEKKMLTPVALGGVMLHIRPVRTQVGGREETRLDLNIEL